MALAAPPKRKRRAKKTRGTYKAGRLDERARSDGSIAYRYLYYLEGKRKASPTFDSDGEALDWWSRYRAKEPQTDSSIRLGDLVEGWLQGSKAKTRSKFPFERALRGHILVSFLATMPLDDITSSSINKYIDGKRKGTLPVLETDYSKGSSFKKKLAESTIKNHVWIIYSLFEYARREKKFVGYNPAQFKDVATEAIDPTLDEDKAMGRQEQQKVYNYIESEYPDWFPFVSVLLLMGLRFSEAIAIKWKDIAWGNFEDPEALTFPILHIRRNLVRSHEEDYKYVFDKGKSKNATRTLRIPRSVCEVLYAHRARMIEKGLSARGDDLVFQTRNGTNLKISNAQQNFLDRVFYELYGGRIVKTTYVLKSGKRKGMKRTSVRYECNHRRTWHSFRHSFVVNCVNTNEIPLSRLAYIVGHSDVKTTLSVYNKFVLGAEERKQGVAIPDVDEIWGSSSRAFASRSSSGIMVV